MEQGVYGGSLLCPLYPLLVKINLIWLLLKLITTALHENDRSPYAKPKSRGLKRSVICMRKKQTSRKLKPNSHVAPKPCILVQVRFLHDLHPIQLMFLDNQKQVLFSCARESTMHWRNTTDNVFTNWEIDWSSGADNESPFIKDTVLIPPALSAQCYCFQNTSSYSIQISRLLFRLLMFPYSFHFVFLKRFSSSSHSAMNLQSSCDCGQELVWFVFCCGCFL